MSFKNKKDLLNSTKTTQQDKIDNYKKTNLSEKNDKTKFLKIYKVKKNKIVNFKKLNTINRTKFLSKLYKKKIKLVKKKFNFRKRKKKWWFDKKTRKRIKVKPRIIPNSSLLKLKKSTYNTYINLHVLHQDYSIKSFVNTVLLKDGKKTKYFNIFIRVLNYLKQITGISPIRIIKALLKPQRLLLMHFIKSKGRRIFNVPKMAYKKIRYGKFLFFFKKNIKNLQIEKKFTIEQKLVYLILNDLLSKNKEWYDLIKTNADLVYRNKRFLFFKKY